MSETRDLVFVIEINTTPEKLWSALTEGDFTRQYWSSRVESTWEVGAPVRFWHPLAADEAERRGMAHNGAGEALSDEGVVLAYDPYVTLAYTFQPLWDEAMRADSAGRVTFSLEPAGDRVKLTLRHQEIPNRAGLLGALNGGWASILSNLASLLESDLARSSVMVQAK